MDLEKLKPWNWFKHEDNSEQSSAIPVMRDQSPSVVGPLSTPGSLLDLHRDMDRWFDEAFRSFGMPSSGPGLLSRRLADSPLLKSYRPQVDVSGDNNHYEVALDVPDMSESDLAIEVKNDVLTIRGHKEDKTETKDKHYYRVERSSGSFQRTLSLPDDANADEISADLKNGVLKLSIPRREIAAEDVKRISISS